MRADKPVPRYYYVRTPGNRGGLVRITQVIDRSSFPKRHELLTPRPGVLSHAKQPSALLSNDFFAEALVSAFELWLKTKGEVRQFDATFTLRCERRIGWDNSGTRTHWLHLRLQCGYYESVYGTPVWHCQVMEVRPIRAPR